MNKRIFTAIAAILLIGVLLAFVVACENETQTKTPSYLNISASSSGEPSSSLYLGEFEYGTQADKDISAALSSLQFTVYYNDGGSDKIEANQVKVSSVTYNNDSLTSLPETYAGGNYNITYEYNGATGSVYFTVTTSATGANYVIEGLPSSWIYSSMPDLTSIAKVTGYETDVVFTGTDANAQLNYVTKELFDELSEQYGNDTAEFKNEIVTQSFYYFPDSYDNMYFLSPGEYRFFAVLNETANYTQQPTNFVSVTVEKETLTFNAPSVPYELSHNYLSTAMTGNIKLSDIVIKPYIPSLTATNSRGEVIELTGDDWNNPDEEINANDLSGKTHKFRLQSTGSDAYNSDNLLVDVKVDVVKGLIEPDLNFDENYISDATVSAGAYEAQYFPLFAQNGMSDLTFGLIEIRDSGGKKLPLYDFDGTTLIEEGEQGAIAKLIKISRSANYSDYYIALNDQPELGTYQFTVNLKDTENYYWCKYATDMGTTPITVNMQYVYNSNGLSYNDVDYFIPAENGQLNIFFSVAASAFDEDQLSALTLNATDAYLGYSTDSDVNILSYSASVNANDGSYVEIEVSATITYPDDKNNNINLCYEINLPVNDNFQPVGFKGVSIISKRYIEDAYYPTYKAFGSDEYTVMDYNATDGGINVDRSLTVGEIFHNLNNEYVNWSISSSTKTLTNDDRLEEFNMYLSFAPTITDALPDYYSNEIYKRIVYTVAVSYFEVKGETVLWNEADRLANLESYINGASNLAETQYTLNVTFDRYLLSGSDQTGVLMNGTVTNTVSQIDDSGLIPQYASMSSTGAFDITAFTNDGTRFDVYENAETTYSSSLDFTLTDVNGEPIDDETLTTVARDYVHASATIPFAIDNMYNALTSGDEYINEMSLIKTAQHDVIYLFTGTTISYIAFDKNTGDFCGYIITAVGTPEIMEIYVV